MYAAKVFLDHQVFRRSLPPLLKTTNQLYRNRVFLDWLYIDRVNLYRVYRLPVSTPSKTVIFYIMYTNFFLTFSLKTRFNVFFKLFPLMLITSMLTCMHGDGSNCGSQKHVHETTKSQI